MRPPARTRAFTLIELIVVLVVLAVLATIAMVGYNAVIDRAKNKALETTVASVAREARALAALRGGTTIVEDDVLTAMNDLGTPAGAGQAAAGGWERATGGAVTAAGKLHVHVDTDGRAGLAATTGPNGTCVLAQVSVSSAQVWAAGAAGDQCSGPVALTTTPGTQVNGAPTTPGGTPTTPPTSTPTAPAEPSPTTPAQPVAPAASVLALGAVAPASVSLSWEGPAGETVTYRLTRSLNGAEPVTRAEGLTAPSFADTTARAGNTYVYAVYAVDSATQLTSPISNTVTTTPPFTTPGAPALNPTAASIQVTIPRLPGTTTSILQRSTNGVTWADVYTGTSTSFTDTDVQASTIYRYRILGYNPTTDARGGAGPSSSGQLVPPAEPNVTYAYGYGGSQTQASYGGSINVTFSSVPTGTTMLMSWRYAGGGWSGEVATTARNNFIGSNIAGNSTVEVRARAQATSGLMSGFVTGTVVAPAPSAAVTELNGQTSGSGKLVLNMRAGNLSGSAFIVERSTDGVNWTYYTTNRATNPYVTNGLYTLTVYNYGSSNFFYRVSHQNGTGGYSAYTGALRVAT